MKSRILVSVVGVPLILAVVLWAPIGIMAGFLAGLSAIAAWELMRCVAWCHVGLDSPHCSVVLSGSPFPLTWYPKLPLG